MTHRIVTPHMTQRTAERGLSHLWAVQARALRGDTAALAILERLGIDARTDLSVRMERKRFYKWAVVEPK